MNAKQVAPSVWMLCLLVCSCTTTTAPTEISSKAPEERQLPYIGEHDVEFRKLPSGAMEPDTQYYQIPKFNFLNENGRVVSHRDAAGKVVVADFFFSTCKTICPIMSMQLLRLQEKIKNEPWYDQVLFLSHTVDPVHDRPDTLKAYAMRIDADTNRWHFLTGDAEDIYSQAQDGYMLTAFPSDTADGGFFHTDKVTLLDREQHIRGYYDGTSTKSMDELYEDLKLLVEQNHP